MSRLGAIVPNFGVARSSPPALDRLIVVPCSVDTDVESLRRSNELFAREVLPGLVEA
jgi:hypothetical protein